MRSLAVLAVAALLFAAFLIRNHGHAQHLLRAERSAAERARAVAAAPPGPPLIEGGYRFEWLPAGELPPAVFARPERHGEDGVCRFVALPDGTVFAFDAVAHRTPGGEVDPTPLRIHLARGPAEGGEPALPPGWRRLE